jgi:hypothetical protein
MKIYSLLILWMVFFLPLAHAEDPIISQDEMLKLINSASGPSALYQAVDITEKDQHRIDLNGDGISELVVIPETACGETKNCNFFIFQNDKKKGWKLILNADGKITSLTPWGFVASPRKTQAYSDLIAVFDRGPEPDATRYLDRRVYVWDGSKYVLFTETYPPETSSSELSALLQKVDQLKYEKVKRR